MPELDVDTRERLIPKFVRRFELTAQRAVAAHGRFSCALPGGSVAMTFFPALVGAAVEWPLVDVFWCDERAVPPSDPESNYGLALRLWLRHVDVTVTRVHPIRADHADLDGAATEYDAELVSTLGNPPRLDLVVLGMGPDGHVCSLFPGHAALSERERAAVAVRDAPKSPRSRITITLPVLAAAADLYLVALGTEKAEAVRETLEKTSSPMPAALAIHSGPRVVCMFDHDAASALRRY